MAILAELRFFVALFLFVFTLRVSGRLLWWAISKRREARKEVEDSLVGVLSDLLERDMVEDVIRLCETELQERPNKTACLWYLARAHRLREERTRVRDYLERLRRVDPKSEAGYASGYWAWVDGTRETQGARETRE